MRKLLAGLFLLWAGWANAADNAVTLTVGSGVTMRTTDVGSGVQSSNVILSSTSGGGTAIYGTAGIANANVLTIQGIASGTVVPVSLTSTTITGTVAATQSGTWNIGTVTTITGVTTVSTVTNLAQMNGAALLMGNGVTGTGSQRVTIASDNTAFSVNATVVNANANGSATSANSSPVVIASDQVAVAIKAASGVFASGSIASGALSSGSVASGAFASGSIGSGALASGSIASGAYASGSIGSGAISSGAYASGAVSSGAYSSGSLASGAVVDITNMSATTAAAVPAKAIYSGVNVGGNLVGVVGDPCQTNVKVYQTISQTTNTQLFAGTSSKKTYVCHIIVVGADAENISLVSGTGSVCATSTAAVIGSTTAAAGLNLSANGGFSIGAGGYSVAVSAVNADNVCLFQSGSGRVAGVMSYVAQ